LLAIGAATVVGAAVINKSQESADAKQRQDAKDAITALKGKEESAYKRATNQSINLMQDIISDANGVSFHRFQMGAWTLVLGFIFGLEVWKKLGMPDFDNTLLGLQGLSAATYLGLKVTEPTVPDAAKKPGT